MRGDEFNSYNITNERESFSSFEFGHTQNNESTSYKDNKTNIRDEINDNRTFNSDKKRDSEKEERKRMN